MLIYPICPSCGEKLSNKQIPYEEEYKKLCDNDKLTDAEKANMQQKLLEDTLCVKNYCSKMRITTHIDLIKIIK